MPGKSASTTNQGSHPYVSCMKEGRDSLQAHLSSGEHLLTHVALTRNFHLVEWIDSWEARIY